MYQRSGVSVADSVRRQRMVTNALLYVVASSSSDDGGNCGYGCGTGICSRPS